MKTKTIIEFCDERIKIAQAVYKKGRYIPERLIARPIHPESGKSKDTQIVQSIKKLMHDTGINTSSCISILPRSLFSVKFLRLPSVKESEIKGMVSIQAAKQLPFAKEDIIEGFKIASLGKDGFSNCVVAMAHQDIIDRHLKILSEAGLEPEAVRTSSEALWSFYIDSIKRKGLAASTDPVILVDIDSSLCEILIFEGGQLQNTRSVPIASSDKWQEALAQEVQRTFAAYQQRRREKKPILEIFVSGAGASLPMLERALSEKFGIAVGRLGYGNNLKASGEFSFSSCLTCLYSDDLSINLMPPALKETRIKSQKFSQVLKTSVLSVLIAVAISAGFTFEFFDRSLRASRLNDRLKEIAPAAEKIEAMQDKIDLIEERLSERGLCLDIIAELYKIVPREITLGAFTFEERKAVSIRGSSKAMSDVFKFVSILEKSDYFHKVNLRYANKRRVEQAELTDFQITCPLKP